MNTPTDTPTTVDTPMPGKPHTTEVISATYQESQDVKRLATDDIRNFLPDVPVHDVAIRASTYSTRRSCPRRFLLGTRMGLHRPRLKAAATLGSAFHEAMRAAYSGADRATWELAADLEVERAINGLEAALGPADDPDIVEAARDRLEKDLGCAKAMAQVFLTMYPPMSGWETVAVEQELACKLPHLGAVRIVSPIEGRIDRLIWDPNATLLRDTPGYWLIDYKTVDAKKNLRDEARSYKFAIATQIYRLLATHWLREQGMKPPLLGMIHCLVAKPGIRLSREDRDFTEVPKTLKSGPRKGLTIMEKVYDGPPRLSNYLDRVQEWYTGTGRYESFGVERQLTPKVYRAATIFTGPLVSEEFATQLYEHSRACRAMPCLSSYYRDRNACYTFYRTCPFLPLCESSATMWQSIIESERLIPKENPNEEDSEEGEEGEEENEEGDHAEGSTG